MHAIILGVLAMALAAGPDAKGSPGDWAPLVQARDFEKARTLCEGWLSSGDDATKAEAHKCLANVELGAHGEHALRLGGDDGGGFAAQKAVKAAPNDPVDAWTLARVYDQLGRLEKADAAYRKALALQPDAERAKGACVVAEFLLTKRKDWRGACALQQQHECEQSACVR